MDINSISVQISNVVTGFAQHAWAVIGNFLALLILTVLMIVISYRSRGGIISFIVALYMGYGIYALFPYASLLLSFAPTPLLKTIISIVLYLICIIIPFLFIERLTHGGFGILSFVPRFVLSFVAATFLLAIAYHLFDVNHLYTFPKPLNQLFAPDKYFFLWFIAPLVGLFFLVH